MGQVSNKDYPGPLMNVLTTCAKILSSSSKLSKMISLEKTKCSPEVWASCRKQLVAKVGSKKGLSLDWIPETLGGNGAESSAKIGKDEL